MRGALFLACAAEARRGATRGKARQGKARQAGAEGDALSLRGEAAREGGTPAAASYAAGS